MVGFGAVAVVYYLTIQAVGGAHEAIDGVLTLLSQQTSVSVEGNSWFSQQFGLIRTMALWVMLPLILLSVMQSIAKGDMAQLVKSAVLYPAVALLGTIAAIRIVQLLIGISDDFSNVFLAAAGEDVNVFFDNVKGAGFVEEEDIGKQIIILILSTLMIFGGLITFLMLIVREASIYLATAFLPLGFAMLVWPAAMRWFRTMVEFLIGIIFSKVLMCAILAIAVASLGAAGLGGDTGQDTLQLTGAAVGTQDDENPFAWFAFLAVPVVLLFMMGASPGAATKMTGSFGLENAVGALASNIGTRPNLARPFLGIRRGIGVLSSFNNNRKAGKALREERTAYAGRSRVNMMLAANGMTQDANRSIQINPRDVQFIRDQAAGIAARPGAGAAEARRAALMNFHADQIRDLGDLGNPANGANEVQFANQLLQAYQSGGEVLSATTFNRGNGDGQIAVAKRNADGSNNVRVTVVDPVVNASGRAINRINTRAAINRINQARSDADALSGPGGTSQVTYLSGRATPSQGRQTVRLRNQFLNTNVDIRGNVPPSAEGGARIEFVNGF